MKRRRAWLVALCVSVVGHTAASTTPSATTPALQAEKAATLSQPPAASAPLPKHPVPRHPVPPHVTSLLPRHDEYSRSDAAKILAKRRDASDKAIFEKHSYLNETCDPARLGNPRIEKEVLKGRRKYASCAVVGSSGKLVNSSLGPEIDAHEFVVRHNNAPTRGFEDDVGGKTSMMIRSTGSVRALMNLDEKGLFECPPKDELTYYTARNVTVRHWLAKRCKQNNASHFIEDLRDYVNSETLGRSLRSPNAGTLMAGPSAIVIALRVCHLPIDLYGFTVGNVSDYDPWPYHYYDDVKPAKWDHIEVVAANLRHFIVHTVHGCIDVRI